MFDIGGWEFLIIIVVAIIIVGPKDLPGLVRTISEWIRKARGLAREFQSGLDDLAREVDIEKLGKEVTAGIGLDESGNSIRQQIENTIDPKGEIADAFSDSEGLLEDNPLDDDEEFRFDDDAEELLFDGEEEKKNIEDDRREEIASRPVEGSAPEEPASEATDAAKPGNTPLAREA